MRWVSKPPRPEPQSGDWRKRKGFLIFPKKDELETPYHTKKIPKSKPNGADLFDLLEKANENPSME